MFEDLRCLVDENGDSYDIDEELGRGGQGIVYKLKDHNLVAKLKLSSMGMDHSIAEYNNFKNHISYVSTLQLPNDIKIVKPLSFLEKPKCGYIMQLMDDMIPLSNIIKPLEGVKILDFYRNTGGLIKRLKILKNLAYTLEKLRSLSIVYADLSPYNIYVSEELDKAEVWLIDPDNMRYTMDFRGSIITPDYGAPEVVAGRRSNDVFSDNYSFALIAFEFLSFTMPFYGNAVLNPPTADEADDWADSDNSMENKALSGELPWILDREDSSNSFDINYFPEGFEYCPSNLMELFHKTFSYEGRNNPDSRPNMREWYIEISKALDELYICRHCGNSFHYKTAVCPFCKYDRDKIFVLGSFRILNIDKLFKEENIIDDADKNRYKKIVNDLSKKTIRRRVLNNFSFNKSSEDILNIEIYNYDTSFIKFLDEKELLFRLIKDSNDKFYYIKESDKINLAYININNQIVFANLKEKYTIPSLDNQVFLMSFKRYIGPDNFDLDMEDTTFDNAGTLYKFLIKLV